jgi:hypothetical protein
LLSIYLQLTFDFDKIMIKYVKNHKMHVDNFQERHFLRIKKNNAKNIAQVGRAGESGGSVGRARRSGEPVGRVGQPGGSGRWVGRSAY